MLSLVLLPILERYAGPIKMQNTITLIEKYLTTLFEVHTISQKLYIQACCRQYEMGECVRAGFCNFMHLKPISRELRRDLYGR